MYVDGLCIFFISCFSWVSWVSTSVASVTPGAGVTFRPPSAPARSVPRFEASTAAAESCKIIAGGGFLGSHLPLIGTPWGIAVEKGVECPRIPRDLEGPGQLPAGVGVGRGRGGEESFRLAACAGHVRPHRLLVGKCPTWRWLRRGPGVWPLLGHRALSAHFFPCSKWQGPQRFPLSGASVHSSS